MKWSWRQPEMKKLHVKVRPLKLEGLNGGIKDGNLVVVKMKWKGPKSKSGLPQFRRVSTSHKSYSRAHKFVDHHQQLQQVIEWEDDEFESICDFSSNGDGFFSSWDVSFHVLSGVDAESKTKFAVLGNVCLNLGEIASRMDYQVEKKLPLFLQINGVATQATLLISVSFAELRNCNDGEHIDAVATKKNKTNEADLASCSNSDDSFVFNSGGFSRSGSNSEELSSSSTLSPETRSEMFPKVRLFSWKKRRLNFGLATRKAKPLIDNAPNLQEEQSFNTNTWELKELISRDGQAKLKTDVFFASYDQRSEKAAGESACTALVVVIAHWLQSNKNSTPTKSQFDSLITEGSSLWRNLCQAYTNSFPDSHFDLETVIKADLRPVTISQDESFTGMFSPEKFENSKEAFMPFDSIWEEISSSIEEDYENPKIYIVSWNDHFFVLKVEADAYYIVDSFGERLFEGCNQAYILKFDDSSLMSEKATKESNGSEEEESGKGKESEKITCKGKECCREFIKRFFAAIPVGELEEEEKKGPVSTVSLLQRLQIDFHYCSSSSSSTSSSSPASSTSSLFSGEGQNIELV